MPANGDFTANRRQFLQYSGLAGIGAAAPSFGGGAAGSAEGSTHQGSEFDLYLEITGPDIKGDVTTQSFEGQIRVRTWTWGLGSATADARRAGPVQFDRITVVKSLDAVTPLLLEAAAQQRRFQEVILRVVRPQADGPAPSFRVTLDTVLITAVQTGVAEDGGVVETLTLAPETVNVAQLPDGPETTLSAGSSGGPR